MLVHTGVVGVYTSNLKNTDPEPGDLIFKVLVSKEVVFDSPLDSCPPVLVEVISLVGLAEVAPNHLHVTVEEDLNPIKSLPFEFKSLLQ